MYKKLSKYYIPDGVKATFGNWTFIENIQTEGDPTFYYRVRCSCGLECIRRASQIAGKNSNECHKCMMTKRGEGQKKIRIEKAIKFLDENGYKVSAV